MFLSTEEGHSNGQAVDLLTALLEYLTVLLVYIDLSQFPAFGWNLLGLCSTKSYLPWLHWHWNRLLAMDHKSRDNLN